ncbi:hypothetical protein BX600DRAFT_447423 [Xylariales sp. PMI_506]|nr:hypothetical protein BX600DRAFT_447423 [Xylariales sp. PMI_506]
MAESASEATQCELIGEAKPDIAGIGILLGFAAQGFISLALAIWVFFLSKTGRLDLHHEEGTVEHAIEKKRLQMVSKLMVVGNDIQMLTGAALLISTFASYKTIDLYHLHLVFDTVCFVGVSNCAAMVCQTYVDARNDADAKWDKAHKRKHKYSITSPQYRVSYVFALFFAIFGVALEIRLKDWSLTSTDLGNCYRTDGISSFGARHPAADQGYVAVTSIWLLATMAGTIWGTVHMRRPLLILAALQYPLHLYFMIALRLANTDHLEGEESENAWDFGQTTAMILLGVAVKEIIARSVEYYTYERAARKHGLPSHRRHHEHYRINSAGRIEEAGDDDEPEQVQLGILHSLAESGVAFWHASSRNGSVAMQKYPTAQTSTTSPVDGTEAAVLMVDRGSSEGRPEDRK